MGMGSLWGAGTPEGPQKGHGTPMGCWGLWGTPLCPYGVMGPRRDPNHTSKKSVLKAIEQADLLQEVPPRPQNPPPGTPKGTWGHPQAGTGLMGPVGSHREPQNSYGIPIG